MHWSSPDWSGCRVRSGRIRRGPGVRLPGKIFGPIRPLVLGVAAMSLDADCSPDGDEPLGGGQSSGGSDGDAGEVPVAVPDELDQLPPGPALARLSEPGGVRRGGDAGVAALVVAAVPAGIPTRVRPGRTTSAARRGVGVGADRSASGTGAAGLDRRA